jgi:uncharacterized protein (TIGR02246 family)
MSTEQQTESGWVRRYIDAWNSHDGSAVGGFFADDGVYTEVTLEGPDAIREFVDGIVDSSPPTTASRWAKW